MSQPRPSALRRWLDKNTRLWRAAISFATIFGLWELAGQMGKISTFAFSWPSKVFKNLWELVATGVIWPDLGLSTTEFVIGFGLAVVVAIPLGLIVGYFRTLEVGFGHYITALYVTPIVALAPILVLWFGLGPGSKIAVVFVMSMFPILINTMSGVKHAPSSLLRAARSFGAKEMQIFRTVLLPASLPYILAGVRIGVGRGIVGLVVGEMIAASAGIGFRIQLAAARFKNSEYLAAVFVLLLISQISIEFIRYLEHRLVPWQRGN